MIQPPTALTTAHSPMTGRCVPRRQHCTAPTLRLLSAFVAPLAEADEPSQLLGEPQTLGGFSSRDRLDWCRGAARLLSPASRDGLLLRPVIGATVSALCCMFQTGVANRVAGWALGTPRPRHSDRPDAESSGLVGRRWPPSPSVCFSSWMLASGWCREVPETEPALRPARDWLLDGLEDGAVCMLDPAIPAGPLTFPSFQLCQACLARNEAVQDD